MGGHAAVHQRPFQPETVTSLAGIRPHGSSIRRVRITCPPP
jgi:hypothetical protein